MESRKPLQRKTPLRAKTQLRAKSWGIKPKKKPPTREESAAGRAETYRRSRGMCDLCGERTGESGEVHHAHFRSVLAPAVVDEPWNRTWVHQSCHARAHKFPVDRDRLRELTLLRLRAQLGDEIFSMIVASLPDGSTPLARAIAYQRWRLGK